MKLLTADCRERELGADFYVIMRVVTNHGYNSIVINCFTLA